MCSTNPHVEWNTGQDQECVCDREGGDIKRRVAKVDEIQQIHEIKENRIKSCFFLAQKTELSQKVPEFKIVRRLYFDFQTKN